MPIEILDASPLGGMITRKRQRSGTGEPSPVENPPPKLATFDTKVQRFSKGLATLLKMAPAVAPSLPEKSSRSGCCRTTHYTGLRLVGKVLRKTAVVKGYRRIGVDDHSPPFSATFRMKEQLVITG